MAFSLPGGGAQTPGEPSPFLLRLVRFLAVAGAVIALAHALDGWAQVTLVDTDIYEDDFGRLLRVMGFYPLWLLAGVALLLTDWPAVRCWMARREAGRRAGLLILSPALGGLVAEVGKVALRRLRPGEVPGEYVFRSWAERPFYSGGLGLPSSHTLVAFAAAAMLARLFPRAAPVWYLLAAGCGLSRVAAGAHYLSDVTVAAVLGWLTAWAIWNWNFGRGRDESLAARAREGAASRDPAAAAAAS
jgi:membrane-associated phospholipid phosphatase